MGFVSLADFIDKERKAIVAEWETFARTLLPAAGGLNGVDLRDHADEILSAIVHDMCSRQSGAEQAAKSKGDGEAQHLSDIGRLHAALRLDAGFKISQMVAEYRALRASVLRLWGKIGTDADGVMRFNEAIDEALTEAVRRFTETTEHYRDQSLGILSHDLRNPLTGIIAGTSLLINSDELGAANLRIATRMASSANRMNRMIADLLDLTRTRFGDAIPIVRAPIDLHPICRQVVAELEGLHLDGGLSFTQSGDLHGEWDGDRIAQVLSNLLRNAIQHGSPKAPIHLIANGEGPNVLLTVHNSGKKISASALKSIFEPMVRHVGNLQNSNSGLGLGLYIASQVVIAHGATIDVTSTDAGGTTFTVDLPRHATAPRRHGAAPSEASPAPAASTRH